MFVEISFYMGDGTNKIKIIPDYFEVPTTLPDSHQQGSSPILASDKSPHQQEDSSLSIPLVNSHQQTKASPSHSSADNSSRSSFFSLLPSSVGRTCLWTRRKLRISAGSMLKLFSLRGLPFAGSDGEEKVEIAAAELESLRSELTDLGERESHLKAQLEHVDEILRWARLSGYLYMRTRWTALPGEPPAIDDCEVDDWIPRFIVLQGPCIFLYQTSTDLSPQDSTLLADIVEVGALPDLVREDEEIRYCFYILTRFGLRYECSSISKVQVDSWLTALQTDCKLKGDKSPRLPELKH
ncbi:hypothetical protein Drorol1_Dr00013346 [Drosera rotundifolia]